MSIVIVNFFFRSPELFQLCFVETAVLREREIKAASQRHFLFTCGLLYQAVCSLKCFFRCSGFNWL